MHYLVIQASCYFLLDTIWKMKEMGIGFKINLPKKHTQLNRNDLQESNYKNNESVNDNSEKPFTNQDLSNAFAMSNSLFETYQSQTNELESNLDMAVGTQLFLEFINNMADQINTDPEVRARIYNVNQFHSNYKVGET